MGLLYPTLLCYYQLKLGNEAKQVKRSASAWRLKGDGFDFLPKLRDS